MSKKSDFEKENEKIMGGRACETEKGEGRKIMTGDGRTSHEEQECM